MMYSIGAAAALVGVSVTTLRRWEKEGKVRSDSRTVGQHRRYSYNTLRVFLPEQEQNQKDESGRDRAVVGYARVSSHDQKEDLKRQTDRLSLECKKLANKESLAESEIISDLGSGLNLKKKGLIRLVQLLLMHRVHTLVLTHQDRLLRFGSELVFRICKEVGTKVLILDENVSCASNEEILAKDVLEIITVFSARLYGKRSHQNRKRINAETKTGYSKKMAS